MNLLQPGAGAVCCWKNRTFSNYLQRSSPLRQLLQPAPSVNEALDVSKGWCTESWFYVILNGLNESFFLKGKSLNVQYDSLLIHQCSKIAKDWT